MKVVVLQLKDNALFPFSVEDAEVLKGYCQNQPIKAKLYGIKKPRSYQQLKLYWACCRTVADNIDGMTSEDVDFEIKVRLKHLKRIRVVAGVATVEVDSISYARLEHIDACGFFERAFPVMAKMIGVSVDELLRNAE